MSERAHKTQKRKRANISVALRGGVQLCCRYSAAVIFSTQERDRWAEPVYPRVTASQPMQKKGEKYETIRSERSEITSDHHHNYNRRDTQRQEDLSNPKSERKRSDALRRGDGDGGKLATKTTRPRRYAHTHTHTHQRKGRRGKQRTAEMH